MAISNRLVQLATFVDRMEEHGITIIDASVSRGACGARVAVRGTAQTLTEIAARFADDPLANIDLGGDVQRPIFKISIRADGLDVTIAAINIEKKG